MVILPWYYYMNRNIERMPAGVFKTNCLRVMDDVQAKRKQVIITKRGKPVAKLVPFDEEPVRLFGSMKGSVVQYGNIIDPIDVRWEANE